MSLAKLYPHDFDSGNLRDLSHELGLYISDVRDGDRFSNMQTIAELFQKMVTTGKHERYPMVYRLLKLVLVLPVTTATVERCFSAMKIVKTYLRNRIGDSYMSNSLICYVEKELMMKVTNEAVVRRFMKMQGRRFDDEDEVDTLYFIIQSLFLHEKKLSCKLFVYFFRPLDHRHL